MAAVEADVLRRRLDDEGSNAGVMVSSSSGAMRPMENAAASAASANPVTGFLRAPVVRAALPYVTIALVLMLAVVAYMSMSTPPPRTLYPEMADSDKEAAQQLLQKNTLVL